MTFQSNEILNKNYIDFRDKTNVYFLLNLIDKEIKSFFLKNNDLKKKLFEFKSKELNNLILNLLDTYSNKPLNLYKHLKALLKKKI